MDNNSYPFTIKAVKKINFLNWFKLLGVLFCAISLSKLNEYPFTLVFSLSALLIFLFVLQHYFYKLKQVPLVFFYISLFIISVNVFLLMGIYFAILLFIFFAFIQWFTKQNTLVFFTNDFIQIKKGISNRKINWTSLNSVMYKDGVLTIDFKNDKLIQEEVIDVLTQQEIVEFLNYCNVNISKNL